MLESEFISNLASHSAGNLNKFLRIQNYCLNVISPPSFTLQLLDFWTIILYFGFRIPFPIHSVVSLSIGLRMSDGYGEVQASLIVNYDLYHLHSEFKYEVKLREQKSMQS